MSHRKEVANIISVYYRKYAMPIESTLALRRMTIMSKITPCNRMALIACMFDWNTIYSRANKHMGFKVKVSSYTRLHQLKVPAEVIEPIRLYPKKLRLNILNGYTWNGIGRSPFVHLRSSNYLSDIMTLHDCLRITRENDESMDITRLEKNINMLLKDVI